MMKSEKTVWFFWWGWNPVNMENMLERMAADGWKLISVDFYGIRFRFSKDEPDTLRYCTDYQPAPDAEYLSLFEDDGWDLTWNGAGGWYLWRKAYSGDRPEIFTETSSLIDRNNKLLKLLTPLFVMLMFIFILLLLLNRDSLRWMTWIYAILITLYIYMIAQLNKYNGRLKSEIRE